MATSANNNATTTTRLPATPPRTRAKGADQTPTETSHSQKGRLTAAHYPEGSFVKLGAIRRVVAADGALKHWGVRIRHVKCRDHGIEVLALDRDGRVLVTVDAVRPPLVILERENPEWAQAAAGSTPKWGWSSMRKEVEK